MAEQPKDTADNANSPADNLPSIGELDECLRAGEGRGWVWAALRHPVAFWGAVFRGVRTGYVVARDAADRGVDADTARLLGVRAALREELKR